MELWDLLDKDRTPLGITHPRGMQYPMPPHTYHTVVSVFTVDSQKRLLLTLRAPIKRGIRFHWFGYQLMLAIQNQNVCQF